MFTDFCLFHFEFTVDDLAAVNLRALDRSNRTSSSKLFLSNRFIGRDRTV